MTNLKFWSIVVADLALTVAAIGMVMSLSVWVPIGLFWFGIGLMVSGAILRYLTKS